MKTQHGRKQLISEVIFKNLLKMTWCSQINKYYFFKKRMSFPLFSPLANLLDLKSQLPYPMLLYISSLYMLPFNTQMEGPICVTSVKPARDAKRERIKFLPSRTQILRNSLVVQWLRLCVLKAGGLGSIPGRGTRSYLQLKKKKILHATLKI